jgi:hypothetical protein
MKNISVDAGHLASLIVANQQQAALLEEDQKILAHKNDDIHFLLKALQEVGVQVARYASCTKPSERLVIIRHIASAANGAVAGFPHPDRFQQDSRVEELLLVPEGQDIYLAFAARQLGISYPAAEKRLRCNDPKVVLARQNAKRDLFGIVYGKRVPDALRGELK